MAYVVLATWRAQEGNEERIAQIIRTLTPLVRAEPGNVYYQAQRSVDDARVFVLYEQYADEASFEAHREAEHFKRWVLGEAVPLLESRERAFYVTLD